MQRNTLSRDIIESLDLLYYERAAYDPRPADPMSFGNSLFPVLVALIVGATLVAFASML